MAIEAMRLSMQHRTDFDRKVGTEGRREESEAMFDTPPRAFKGQLRPYQMKGVAWLLSLYDQGINGILADEMGLGKTVETICFLAHLAERRSIWGPYLIVSPTGTLHNWQEEVTRFCPSLKVLPYWGTVKDRHLLRQCWQPSRLGRPDSSFHVLVTSYKIVVDEQKYFNRVNWQYVILDEAHAIKSAKTLRWKTLLKIRSRNRLLLTGTPVQNNMFELWSLLHFIMPTVFDNHDEFYSWFSKNVEGHAMSSSGGSSSAGGSAASTGSEIKLDEQKLQRLHAILQPFMLRRAKKDVEKEMAPKIEKQVRCTLSPRQVAMYRALKSKVSLTSTESHLMNVLMQLRKVCNHPDLFFRREVICPFHWVIDMEMSLRGSGVRADGVDVTAYVESSRNACEENSIMSPNRNPIGLFLPRLLFEESSCSASDHLRWVDIHTPSHILHEGSSCFGFLRFCGVSPREYSSRVHMFWDVVRLAALDCRETIPRLTTQCALGRASCLFVIRLWWLFRLMQSSELIVDSGSRFTEHSHLARLLCFCTPRATAPPVDLYCSSKRFECRLSDELRRQPECFRADQSVFDAIGGRYHFIRLPDINRLLMDSGKLMALDSLLAQLKSEGHRTLIFSQMTRMMDILEDYLHMRRHRFLRMDGTASPAQRRDLVHDFQTRNDIFIFLLSTRACGLGINLTGADTVVFYDHDWNPTMDEQATDRTHRIGQTRQVTVYRLVTRGTVEERILLRASQKHKIQSTVYAGTFKADSESGLAIQEIKSLLFNDPEGVEGDAPMK